MKSEYVYPSLANRDTPDAWNDAGRPSLRERGKARVREILAEARSTIPPEIAEAVAARLSIARFND
jgi:trimethylamine--corrinoid protein Co-methyltransferase